MVLSGLRASIVICTYDEARMTDLDECIRSLFNQSLHEFETIVVVDHNLRLYRALSEKYACSNVSVMLNDSSILGQASSMNLGVKNSRGEIVCFIDDDAIADVDWFSRLMSAYDDHTVAAGGRIEPLWIGGRPKYLPEDFYWMIGATGDYLLDKIGETRNLWSCNVSYRRTLIDEVGPLSDSVGLGHRSRLFQGEDTEFGVRVSKITGKGVRYVPEARVYHKIHTNRLRLRSFFKRGYEQGYVKARIRRIHGSSYDMSVERDYLISVLQADLERLRYLVLGPDRKVVLEQFAFTLFATLSVLLGFVTGLIKKEKTHRVRSR
jgi:glycosyltransferase involved in cell wall biosynthesis